MKKKRRIVIGIILVIIISTLIVYNYVFNSEHRDIATEEATISMTAEAMFDSFKNSETSATAKYLDKVVELTGTITEVEDGSLVLSNGVQIGFNSIDSSNLKTGQDITVKGRCVGFDELLELVKIDQSTIIK